MSLRTVKVSGQKLLPAPAKEYHRKKKKSSSSSSDDEKARKKRDKKAKKDLVVAKDREKSLKKVGSKFGVSAKEVAKMIDKGDTEKAVGYFQKKLLAATVMLIPIAERKYKKTGAQSHAYAMNALISTARELAQDLQATGDRQKLALKVIGEILQPAFRAVAQSIIDEHYSLKKDLEDYCADGESKRKMKERVDRSGMAVARHARLVYENVSERTNEALIK